MQLKLDLLHLKALTFLIEQLLHKKQPKVEAIAFSYISDGVWSVRANKVEA